MATETGLSQAIVLQSVNVFGRKAVLEESTASGNINTEDGLNLRVNVFLAGDKEFSGTAAAMCVCPSGSNRAVLITCSL